MCTALIMYVQRLRMLVLFSDCKCAICGRCSSQISLRIQSDVRSTLSASYSMIHKQLTADSAHWLADLELQCLYIVYIDAIRFLVARHTYVSMEGGFNYSTFYTYIDRYNTVSHPCKLFNLT